jgi:MerR family transcriptional regulator, light-induced transcriptional regulator
MPGIRTNAAAEVLGVSPNTLRSWERRYGFPTPKRTTGNHRNYDLIELQTLRDALAQTGNISSAVALAQQRQQAPVGDDSLLSAFESFDESAADRAIEESLAVRPLERTVLRPAPSSSSPPVGPPAGCTAPGASPPRPHARPGSS